ncbi:toll/interleukin-1 receptor domain-containing protein [Planctomycetota bacterium]
MATKVFISWSGDLSRHLAEALREWLPSVLQFVKPYFTPADIEKGARWGSDIAGELESSDVGIICLTKDNTQKPWILFEAGALSKSLDKAKVCTVLFDLDTTDLKGPLTIFQHTKFQADEFKKLIRSINNTGGDLKLDDGVLNDVFDMWWPKLEEKVNAILKNHKNDAPTADRPERDMLEEILELTRLGVRERRDPREIHPKHLDELLHGLDRFMHSMSRDGVPSPKALHFLERPLVRIAEQAGHPAMAEEFHYRLRRQMEELRERRDNKMDAKKEADDS